MRVVTDAAIQRLSVDAVGPRGGATNVSDRAAGRGRVEHARCVRLPEPHLMDLDEGREEEGIALSDEFSVG
jgi:hypothetical protein